MSRAGNAMISVTPYPENGFRIEERAAGRPGSAMILLIVAGLVALFLTGCSGAAALSARQVLAKSVANLLALKSYRYEGVSSLRVAKDPRLDNESRFRTTLVQNQRGGLDGHMVVESPGYSYETYSLDGKEYTLVEGCGWTKVERPPGYGMVSTDARRIIARFAELVEDVRMVGQTSGEYTISMVMGEKYRRGAAALVGAGVYTPGKDGSGCDTTMTLVVGRADMRIVSSSMNDSRAAEGEMPAITITTHGTYSDFNRPFSVKPPAEALNAVQVSEEEAPATRQPQ